MKIRIRFLFVSVLMAVVLCVNSSSQENMESKFGKLSLSPASSYHGLKDSGLFDKADTSSSSSIHFKKKNEQKVVWPRLIGVSVFSVGAGVFLHEFQQHAWWSGTREPFHVQNDWAYAMSADKLGHIFVGSLINKTLHDVFIWSGLEDKTALWFASIFSIGYMTDIEIEDGFARAWGYSPGDEISNLTGDVYAISRSLWAPMRNVSFKWSYFPTGDPQHKGDFPDDYNGQVFWLSFTMHNFLSGNIQKYWPSFFNLAVGYGVAKYDDVGPGSRTQYIYMGLDYDFRYIIPGNSEFMKWIKEFINNFKFIPTPALRWNTSTGKFDVIIHL